VKVVFVQSGLKAGGAEKIINLLARHRADLADEVHVLAFSGSRESSYFKYADDIAISTLSNNTNAAKRPFRVIARTKWLRQELQRIRPHVIVSFLTKTNVIALIASVGLGIPVIISERNNPGKQDAFFLWQKAIKLFAPYAAGVVVQTNEARNTISARALGKTYIIPNPNVTFPGIERTRNEGSRIVATGRLSHQKGFDLLLEAFAILALEIPNTSLTLFGDGPERAALTAQAKTLKISDRVFFPGLTKEPGGWLSEADIFVLSSRYEGFPNVLVEALAFGLPSIAFSCPWGPSEILTHEKDGLLVEPENVNALAIAMHRLLTDERQRKKFSDAAPQAAKRFNLAEVLTKWDSVIDQTSQGKR
jgi:glycosyltransferase involved in cell wall biosynthesis